MICEGKLRRYGERVKIGMYSLGLVLDVMAHLSTSFIFHQCLKPQKIGVLSPKQLVTTDTAETSTAFILSTRLT